MIVAPGSVDVTTYFHLRLAADGTDATGLTIANLDLQYCRSGATPAAKVDAVALAAADTAHTDNRAFEIDATDQPGVYRVDWPDAAFASGVREVILTVKVATAFTESLRVDLTPVPANVTQWLGTAAATPTVAGVPEVDATHYLGSAAPALVGGRFDSSTGAMAANVLTATAINNDAITAAKLAADVTTELQSGLATAAALATVDGIVDDILLDTAEIGTAGAGLSNINLPNQTMDIVGNITGNLSGSVGSVTGAVGSVTGAVGSVTGAVGSVTGAVGSVTGAVGSVTGLTAADVGSIKTKTDSLTFTGAGRVDANISAVNNSTTGIDKLSAHLPAILKVIVDAGSTTTAVVLKAATGIDGGAPSAVNDFYNGRVIVFTSGALAGQATDITDYVGATVTLTVTALTGAPADTVTAVIV